MLSKRILSFVIVLLVFLCASCGEEEYAGEDVANYPNLSELLSKNWDMEHPVDYWKVSLSAGKKDSVLLKDTEMPWTEIKEMFKKADINKEELNHHYAIDLMQDSSMNTTTVYYKALAPKDYTRKIDIISNGVEGEMTSLYFETATDGGKISKVLFLKDKLIQIQKRASKSDAIKVETYYFLSKDFYD